MKLFICFQNICQYTIENMPLELNLKRSKLDISFSIQFWFNRKELNDKK